MRIMMNLKWVFLVYTLSQTLICLGSDRAADPIVQQQLDKIEHLPGQSFSIRFSHYSGYVNVDEKTGRNLFYWLTESSEDSSSKPLVLWLSGNPGCSSVVSGEGEEIGPFHIQADRRTLYLNQYAWNQAANILFLDSPAWAGYSYSNNKSEMRSNGDIKTAKDNLAFLLNWLERFPQYKGRDLFLTGESYAGYCVPQLSQAILKHNSATNDTSINLRGFMVGNAMIDYYHDLLGFTQFIWCNGLISDETYRLMNQACVKELIGHSSSACLKIMQKAFSEMGSINYHSIFTPLCQARGSTNRSANHAHIGSISAHYDPCTRNYSWVYFSLLEVREALHVHPKAAHPAWFPCNGDVFRFWGDSPKSMLDLYHDLIQEGLRIWVFSGNTDGLIPVTATRYSIQALQLKTRSPWRPWEVDGQVAGWVQEFEGLTFATVRAAGRQVPSEKPKEALVLFKSFLSGKLPRETYTSMD